MAAREDEAGPVESTAWPTELDAHVVEPGPAPRMYGYDVQADLAPHYGFADLLLLACTGELPDAHEARALEIALLFLSPASVAEAPVHAAWLSRLCGATTGATVAVAAIAFAEQARFVLAEHEDLFAWLADPSGPFPARHRAHSEEEARAMERLSAALAPTGVTVSALDEGPTLTAALLSALYAVGLRQPAHIELAWTLSRLPAAVAEAGHVRPLAFRSYPMNTPPFRYESDR